MISDNEDIHRYERVELQEDYARRRRSSEDGGVQVSVRLPAKALSPRRSLVPFAIAGLIAFLSIVSMIVLLHYLPRLTPDDSSTYLGETSPKSCDLTKPSNSTIENAFTINLRSGQHLSFSQAKMIDVAWDLIVGQGGRLCMAWAAYRVFMDSLVSLMETTPISYDLYVALVFDTTSLSTTWKATKAIVRSRSWRCKVFVIISGLATVYVLSFPTMMGAATGYVNPSQVGYMVGDGDLATADSSNMTQCYGLFAGALIGETNNTVVKGPQALDDDYSSDVANWDHDYYDYMVLRNYSISDFSHNLTFVNKTSNYTTTEWPSTNSGSGYELNYTTQFTWHNHTYTFQNYDFDRGYQFGFCYGDKLLPQDTDENSQCMDHDYFVWGFSSKFLEVILYLQIAWTFMMLFMWLHANMTSQLLFKNRSVRGNFRAIADVAEAMKDVLGDEYCAYSDEDIARELKREKYRLRYYTAEDKAKGISHIGLGSNGSLGLDNSRLYGFNPRRRRLMFG